MQYFVWHDIFVIAETHKMEHVCNTYKLPYIKPKISTLSLNSTTKKLLHKKLC